MPNSIKTNILNQNFAHYNNKDTLKLPNYFFKGHLKKPAFTKNFFASNVGLLSKAGRKKEEEAQLIK